MDNRFPAICRLKHETEIKAVFANRDIHRGERLIFYRAPVYAGRIADVIEADKATLHRFCFVVSKKCGNAVKRNRIKRVLREIIRKNRFRIAVGFDYIIRVIDTGVANIKIEEDIFLDDFARYFRWN